jgi:hypothetical protein
MSATGGRSFESASQDTNNPLCEKQRGFACLHYRNHAFYPIGISKGKMLEIAGNPGKNTLQ